MVKTLTVKAADIGILNESIYNPARRQLLLPNILLPKLIFSFIVLLCLSGIYTPLYLEPFGGTNFPFLLIVTFVSFVYLKLDARIIVFLPFFISAFWGVINGGPPIQLAKYLFYFIWFAGFLSYSKRNSWVYSWVVNIYAALISISIFTFLLTLLMPDAFQFDWQKGFSHQSSFFTRQDWDYQRLSYFLVYPANSVDAGITGLPRFFGPSTEPTLFSISLAVMSVIAILDGKKIALFIFFTAIVLASSYFVLIVFSAVWLTLRGVYSLLLIPILLFLIWVYPVSIGEIIGTERLHIYSFLVESIAGFSVVGPSGLIESGANMPYGFFAVLHQYGGQMIFGIFGTLLLIYFKIFRGGWDYQLFMLFSALVLIANKSGEPFSVLFLFLLCFLLCRADQKKFSKQ